MRTSRSIPKSPPVMADLSKDHERTTIRLEDILIDCWADVKDAVDKMKVAHPKWEAFLIEFIANNGNVGTAYTMKINRHITENLATAAGSAILRDPTINDILLRVRQSKNEAALIAINTFTRATTAKTFTKAGQEVEDTQNQVAGATSLAKMQGVMEPEKVNVDIRMQDLEQLMGKRQERNDGTT